MKVGKIFFLNNPFLFCIILPPSSTFKNDATCLLTYLQRDAAKAEPVIKLLSAMNWLEVKAYVVITIFDPKMTRIKYFITSFIVVLAVSANDLNFKSRYDKYLKEK